MCSQARELYRTNSTNYRYERTTQLSKRVTEWTERLEPILAAEEMHPPFDIHKVGDNIVERLVETRRTKTNPRCVVLIPS